MKKIKKKNFLSGKKRPWSLSCNTNKTTQIRSIGSSGLLKCKCIPKSFWWLQKFIGKAFLNVLTSKTNLQTTTQKRSTDNNDLQKIKCKKLLLATKIKQKIPARGNLDVSEDWRLPFKMWDQMPQKSLEKNSRIY